MPIASIGSGAGFFSVPELSAREIKSPEQRKTAAQAASLPGNGERVVAPDEQGPARMAMEIANLDRALDRRLKFEVDHMSNEVTVKVIDNATDEVLRVLPPEELQRLHRSPREAGGSLLNERA